MTDDSVGLRMARIEAAQLLQLVEDFRDLIAARDRTDPAIARLTPDAYPDDESASRAFADATRDDLLARRAVDADVVRTSLGGLRADIGALSPAQAGAEHVISLRPAEVDSWIRTLAALRLVVAARLGIADDDAYDSDDPRYGIYDWLGYRLEVVIQAADALL
ncbi:DUF2017 family protein [Microbacterium sp. H83]|uniref:DUF2017 family protein n=1 Tax=Microbacterium sp. H83 TaxID=1827324 RepID=UPI0007F4A059|nr:DUF2017 family protein [Microbacterium sp. H83]OAN40852.1 hypothetical protein A4X16_01530 [Microbacterium sp. H83]